MVNDFNSSIAFDARLYKQAYRAPSPTPPCWASRASSPEDAEAIIKGLKRHPGGYRGGPGGVHHWTEDIHMNIEAC